MIVADAQNILVVANETVVGKDLIEAVKRHTGDRAGKDAGSIEGSPTGPASVHVICPQSSPKHGHVIYDESVRDAAENRLKMTIAQMREIGVEATGELMDPDPFSAITDAVHERSYDAIIISTLPETRSGWLRQDLISRVQSEVDCPVEHVVVDLGARGDDHVVRTLVVANQTVGGEPLIEQLKALASEGPHRFVVVCPQGGDETGGDTAHQRLARTLERLEEEGLEAIGQVTHPDAFTATKTALDFYDVDEVVISTFPETRSGWLREDLVGRVQSSTDKPVHHVVSEPHAVENEA